MKLIKDDLVHNQTLMYYMDAILIIYILGVGMGCRYEQLMPPENYLRSIGTAADFLTLMMIILAARAFSGKKSRNHINDLLNKGISHDDIFWSKTASLVISYIELASVTFICSVITQWLFLNVGLINKKSLYYIAVDFSANIIYVFLLGSATLMFGTIIKSISGTVAAGMALEYFGEIPMGFFMILVYHHRWLKFNPFNFLLVQNQIVKTMDHAMSKLSMPASIAGSIMYGSIFLFFAYEAFQKYFIVKKNNHKKA